jgi:hypothetical protein
MHATLSRRSLCAPALVVVASGFVIAGVVAVDVVRGGRLVQFGWRQAVVLAVAASAFVLASLWLARSSARGGAWPLRGSWRWRYEPLDYVGALLIPVAAFALYALRFGRAYDDAYITFRYAESLASGEGFFYNAGEHVLGTTAPGYGVLLGVLGVPDPDSIPFIADCIVALSLAGLGLALYAYGRMNGQRLCGLLAGLLAVTSPFLLSTRGGEMTLLLALVAWGFVAYQADRTVLAALLLALATFVRPDGALALGAVGLHYVIVRRRFPLREAAVVAAVLGPVLLAAAVIYGSPLPNTLDAKLAQRESGLWHPFLPEALAWLLGPDATRFIGRHPAIVGSQSSEGVYVALALVGAAGCLLLTRFRFWLLPLTWAGVLTLGYAALDVPFYHWYAAPLAMAVAITAATGMTLILQLMWHAASRHAPLGRRAAAGLAAVAAVAIIAVYAFSAAMSQRLAGERATAAAWPTAHYRLYSRVSEWLNTSTPKGSSVGYDEIGYIGFHSHNRIVDPFGLVTEDASHFIARREFEGAYRRSLPDYLIFGLVVPVPTAPWFTGRYQPIASLNDGDWKLTIYKRLRHSLLRSPTGHPSSSSVGVGSGRALTPVRTARFGLADEVGSRRAER